MDGIRDLEPAGCHKNIEHMASEVFVALPFREDIILYSLVVHIILLHLKIFRHRKLYSFLNLSLG